MKTSWIKLSYVLFGATLAFGSCVETKESPEVIELRKAAAAKLNADVAFRLAEVKYKDAEASVQQYQAKLDSARYASEVEVFAAQAQVEIQQAKNQLINAQIQFEIETKALEVEKLKNPVLDVLLNDYKAYYSGGYLNDGEFISEGIFDLQQNILNENAIVIDLQNSKDALSFLQKKKEINLANHQSQLADLQSTLKILGDARTSGNYDAAITAARELLNKSTAEFRRLDVAYTNAKTSSDAARIKWDNASQLYTDAKNEKDNARIQYMNKINGYCGCTDETLNYNGFMTAYNAAIAEESSTQTLLSTWTTKYQTALSEKNSAQTTRNSAYEAYLAAKAVVDAAQMNGGVATSAQIADRDAKLVIYDNANTTYNTKSTHYNTALTSYQTAKSNFDAAKISADNMRNRLKDYNTYKSIYTVADNKLPALKTDMDSKKEAYTKLDHSSDSLESLFDNAWSIFSNDQDVVFWLENDRNNINSNIAGIEKDINNKNEQIAEITKEISNLKLGMDINTNIIIDDQIKISQDKIKNWQELLAKYQSIAAALKVQIDAE